MGYFSKLIVILFLIASCKQQSNNNEGAHGKDSISNNSGSNNAPVLTADNDSATMNLSTQILKYLKSQDYVHLSEFIHPKFGIHFSPYGSIDTTKDRKLSRAEFISLSKNQKTVKWGIFEGTGKPINLNLNQYFKRFVYDVDFLNAEKKSVNKIIGESTSINSNDVKLIYPTSDFTEFYFSGVEPKYQGMDWKALVLVFKSENAKPYLVAIIHDQWRV